MILKNLKRASKSDIIIFFLILTYFIILFITAWLSDDSFITFRTVDNLINGHGFTWNISERVQTFTHPLWMFVISVLYFFTSEIYYTALIASMLISLIVVLLIVFKLSESFYNSIIVLLILVFSKSFIDYSTSGLENPLTHLLLVLFFIIYFNKEDGNNKLFKLSLIISLAAINRLDTILLYLPALSFIYLKSDKLKGLTLILLGFLPLILWLLFSLIYYGFPFPNTAYAKLQTGIEHIQLVGQGLHYLLFSVYLDPITPVILLTGIVLPIWIRDSKLYPISIGIIVYLIYLVNIGGDFMGGRFLSAPLLCSAIIMSRKKIASTNKLIWGIVTIVVLGLLSPKPTIFSTSSYGLGPKIFSAFRFGPYVVRSYRGIVDERIYYYEETGLLNNIFERKFYRHSWVKEGLMLRNSNENVSVMKLIGFYGYFAGSRIHIIDPLGLGDPLLSRLPCLGNQPFDEFNNQISNSWRIGHFEREIPAGYLETISSGINLLEDPNLNKFYDKLSILIKGDIWKIGRLQEIWNFNTGKYNYLLENYNKDRKSISFKYAD